MKKKISVMVGAVVCAAVFGLGVYHSDAAEANPSLSFDDISQIVTDQYPGTIMEWEMEKEFNKVVYEVEVRNDGKEYDIKLDGNTGEILKLEEKVYNPTAAKDNDGDLDIKEKSNKNNDDEVTEKANKDDKSSKKADNKAGDNNKSDNQKKPEKKSEKKSSTPDVKQEKQTKKTVIDSDKAIEIALGQFSGTVTDLDLDDDDGRLVYEIEIENGEDEAEIEIDAYTGEIVVIEIDIEDDDDDDDNDDD